MPRDTKLEMSLLIIRLATALFMLVWAVDKLVNPKHAQAVFAGFYHWNGATPQIVLAIGIIQIMLLLAFAGGLFRFFTYGAVLIMHAASTISSLGKMIPPYAPSANILFWAAVPTLAAMLMLFMLRDRDRLLSLGRPA